MQPERMSSAMASLVDRYRSWDCKGAHRTQGGLCSLELCILWTGDGVQEKPLGVREVQEREHAPSSVPKSCSGT